jgi:hypothetical protein
MNQPLVILALLALLSCCQAAPAQQSREPAAVRSTPGYSQLSIANEHGSLVLTSGPDGTVTAVHDGAVLTSDRVRREGDHVRILGAAGETLFDVRVLAGGYLVYPYDANLDWPGAGPATGRYTRSTPRKIIGVMVDPVDAVVASQLDIEPDAAFVIGSVMEGMPAEKAGLKAHDVVVAIQGSKPATVEALREAIDDKQPGDTIKIEVLRRGEPIELDVGVAEESEPDVYDLRAYAPDYWENFLGYSGQAEAYADLARELSEQAARQEEELEEAHQRLAELQDDYTVASEEYEQARQDSAAGDAMATAALAEQRSRVEQLRAELAQQEALLRDRSAAMQLLELDSGGRALMLPPGSAAFGRSAPQAALPDEVDGRLRSMEERLSRLEELLEKLVESDTAKK